MVTLSQKAFKLSAEKDKLVNELNLFMKKYGPTEAAMNETKSFIESDKKLLTECFKEISSMRDKLASSITIEGWEENIEESIEKLEQRAASYNRVKEKNEQMKQFITKFKDLEQRIEKMCTLVHGVICRDGGEKADILSDFLFHQYFLDRKT